MRIVLDKCVPWPMRDIFTGHDCISVQKRGWKGIKNSELLALAAKEFDLFITSDQNIRYQQNLLGLTIAVLELSTNDLRRIRCREVRQSGVQRPASKSSSARLAAASKRPARMSASICRSHWSAANSSNQSRKRANSTAERCETAASRSSTLIPRKTIDRACNCKSLSHPIRTPILTSLLLR